MATPGSEFPNDVLLHKLYQDARSNRNSYFEKLAILNGGTVALVVSAALEPLHDQLRHKYVLGVGLTSLVIAMVVLLLRNLKSTVVEFHAASKTAYGPFPPERQKGVDTLRGGVDRLEKIGVALSAVGIGVLLVEVWFVLLNR